MTKVSHNFLREISEMSIKSGKRFVARLLRIILDTIVAIIGVWHPTKLRYLPPIDNRVVLKSATDLANDIKTGRLRSEEVVRAFIDRCREVQPHINAIIKNDFDNAIDEAKQVDSRIKHAISNNESRDDNESVLSLPFIGVPFTAKDTMYVKGMYLTAGLYTRKGIIAEKDNEIISLLRKSGAIFIAMTNVPELGMWWDSYNKLYGRTNNPYDKSRISGGSSGGEAALIASCGSVFGVGADIGGSIRMPCFFCGIFGHKTTPLVLDPDQVYPPPSQKRRSLLSIGPMCRYACDLKPMLRVMAGPSAAKLELDKPVDFKNIRFYYMESDDNPFHTPIQPEISDAMHKVIGHFTKQGSLSRKVYFKDFKYGLEIWLCAMSDKTTYTTAQHLANHNGEINPFKELLKSLIGVSNHTFCALILCLTELIANSLDEKRFEEMKNNLTHDLHKLLGNNGILVFPAHPQEAVKHNATLLKVWNVAYTQLFNTLNVAITSVPMGLTRNGLPIGVQLISSPLNDRLTIAAAEELERAFGGWVSPCQITC
ncbi:fatty-acid amide hydrolase 2-A-like [Oppia nitens]|uniref:fatty-acid amide hydrolase 2-A-like n=1 Tax=Oppia nitens TaxID=1686743 RepID=UPI0023D9E326|nr:fatty-acid amide hydrolase 2-A-like [Oppia nitens]